MSVPKIEPVSGEKYCRCKQWRKMIHVASEHVQLAENALKRGSKVVHLVDWAASEREHDD